MGYRRLAPSTPSASSTPLYTELMSIFSKIDADACVCADRILSNKAVRRAILENATRGIDKGRISVKYFSCLDNDPDKHNDLSKIGECLSKKTGMRMNIYGNGYVYYRMPKKVD
jgi:hypothetical protein